MRNCGTWSIVGLREDGVTIIHPLFCRSWNCPRCRDRNKRRLLSRLRDVPAYSFMTLTCRPGYWPDSIAAWSGMSAAVNCLFKRIRRRFPQAEVEYFLVWERTKAGWPHAHLLLRAPFIPKAWLGAVWAELTNAPIVDIRAVNDPQHLNYYVAKYLAKDPAAPPGCKRFRSSRNFFTHLAPPLKPGQPAVSSWHLELDSPLSTAQALSYAGHTVHKHPDGSFTAYPPGHPDAPAVDHLTPFCAHQEVSA